MSRSNIFGIVCAGRNSNVQFIKTLLFLIFVQMAHLGYSNNSTDSIRNGVIVLKEWKDWCVIVKTIKLKNGIYHGRFERKEDCQGYINYMSGHFRKGLINGRVKLYTKNTWYRFSKKQFTGSYFYKNGLKIENKTIYRKIRIYLRKSERDIWKKEVYFLKNGKVNYEKIWYSSNGILTKNYFNSDTTYKTDTIWPSKSIFYIFNSSTYFKINGLKFRDDNEFLQCKNKVDGKFNIKYRSLRETESQDILERVRRRRYYVNRKLMSIYGRNWHTKYDEQLKNCVEEIKKR